MTPFVSVIIPCYNHGIYLESTINSILQQTWQEMEIIVVDDGSDSATVEILQNITHSRVRVIYQENGKTSKARNTGFKNSSGNYILSIDADDLVDRSFLEKGLSILESNPSIGVVSSWGNCFGHSNYLWMPSGGGIEYFLEDINCSAFALTRREIWQSNGG
ncbi:MAG: glycosyltransferase family 2 protein, partial [Lewinella sp.]|nr:glycosyltransferase family 2 protein [Lewinella sp.]